MGRADRPHSAVPALIVADLLIAVLALPADVRRVADSALVAGAGVDTVGRLRTTAAADLIVASGRGIPVSAGGAHSPGVRMGCMDGSARTGGADRVMRLDVAVIITTGTAGTSASAIIAATRGTGALVASDSGGRPGTAAASAATAAADAAVVRRGRAGVAAGIPGRTGTDHRFTAVGNAGRQAFLA